MTFETAPKRTATTAPASTEKTFAALSPEEQKRYVIEHLDEALEQGYVQPYYQPVIRTLTGKLCGLEALARWDDPTYGLLSPQHFIETLEEAQLIHKLDCKIIELVCKQYRMNADAGVPIVPISFNLSRLDFDLCDIYNVVERAIREYEVPRSMLNIEITETVFGTDPTYMASMVRKFRSAGYQVWMDDFGSGYSTLNALKDFDFDELKIDMAFLNRFGERSKTILASVVDMAKKLGIQTLAEGVESEEHEIYLRRIGCEKMQGYLYGRPLNYDPELAFELQDRVGIETASERKYLEAIGSVNTLSLSERDFSASNSTHDYVTSMSLAIAEWDGERFRVLDSNRVFREALANIGIDSIEQAEQMINDPNRLLARASRHLVDTLAQDKYARQDFVVGDKACAMRARFITTVGNKTAILISIDDTIEQSERKRMDRMPEALRVLYSIYEHVDIIHLDEGYAEPVFSNAGYHSVYEVPDLNEAVRLFAQNEIYPVDQQRYIEFMNVDTMLERIAASGEIYLVGFFRVRHHSGNYTWKLFGLIHVGNDDNQKVLICIRSTHWQNNALFQEAFDGFADDGWHDIVHEDTRVTDGSLWRALARDEVMGFFWKDRNRRFLGANQTFLDYYGLDSIEDIVGKTDEDMGWHIDPVPFQEDELRILNEGYATRDVIGKCIVQGRVRDIFASKRPVYRNGQIVGLVGYFVDAEGKSEYDDTIHQMPFVDPITDCLNYSGIEAAVNEYVDSFVRLGTDFGLICVDIDSFKLINDEYGHEFGDRVLRRVADEIRTTVGQNCVVGHIYADRFVILASGAKEIDLQTVCDKIEQNLGSIARIDDTPCTIYAFSSFARYSETQDIDELKRLSYGRLTDRKTQARSS